MRCPLETSNETMRPRRLGWLVWLLVAMAIAAGLQTYPDVANVVSCDCIAPLMAAEPLREKLRECSDITQTIALDDSVNVVSIPADVPGWECYVPADPTRPAWLSIRLLKDRDSVVFYPRLAGTDSAVAVYAMDTKTQGRSLFRLAGKGQAWTPASAQFPVDLRCVRHGQSRMSFEIPLRIQLTGKSSQVWHKNGVVFF